MRTVITVVVLCAGGVAGCSDNNKSTIVDAAPDVAADSGGDDSAKPPPNDAVVDAGADDVAADVAPDSAPRLEWEEISADLEVVDHTVTLLDDGRVLIVGGFMKLDSGANNIKKEAYLFDPAANTIAAAGELQQGRDRHSATKLADGRVLIVGGRESGSSPSDLTDIFDPAKSGQAAWSAGPPLLDARIGHAAVLLDSGAVMAVGGYSSGQLNSAELFANGSWSSVPLTMKHARAGLTATVLDNNGKVLVAGGYDGQSWISELEVFDPKTGAWTVSASLKEGRSNHTATALNDGRVLIVGGSCSGPNGPTGCKSNELYNPSTDSVANIAFVGNPPRGHAAVRLLDGRILITGDEVAQRRDKALLFSPDGSWTQVPSLLQGRCRHTATLLDDGSVLVVGGQTGLIGAFGPYVSTAERFYP